MNTHWNKGYGWPVGWWFVHRFALNWNISTAIKCIVMIFGTDIHNSSMIKPTHVGDRCRDIVYREHGATAFRTSPNWGGGGGVCYGSWMVLRGLFGYNGCFFATNQSSSNTALKKPGVLVPWWIANVWQICQVVIHIGESLLLLYFFTISIVHHK